jgi:hypothetical protein
VNGRVARLLRKAGGLTLLLPGSRRRVGDRTTCVPAFGISVRLICESVDYVEDPRELLMSPPLEVASARGNSPVVAEREIDQEIRKWIQFGRR